MTASSILLVEDDSSLREALSETLEADGYSVARAASADAGQSLMSSQRPELVITDVYMDGRDGFDLLSHVRARYPAIPVVMITAYGSIERAVDAMQRGAVDYLVKPFEAASIRAVVQRYLPARSASSRDASASPAVDAADDLCCHDRGTREIADMMARIAATDTTVLLTGESGTGKEVFARYMHDHSARAAGPFVALNCAAIPENLLEATLFGYNRGAFTGAQEAHSGKFEQAQGGTLLLDEVSEMDPGLQAKLLRVLQEREVERLGGKRPIPLDVRVLATSNRDLKRAVANGQFREDLFYRLNVVRIHIPPLRRRPSDILPLARQLLAKHASNQRPPALSPDAECLLTARDWPGNIRELENVIQRALIMGSPNRIEAADLRFEPIGAPDDDEPEPDTPLIATDEPATAAPDVGADLEQDLRQREVELIHQALRARNGNRQQAAEQLGISPRTLRYKLAKLRDRGVSTER